jgi:hypothetical protein
MKRFFAFSILLVMVFLLSGCPEMIKPFRIPKQIVNEQDLLELDLREYTDSIVGGVSYEVAEGPGEIVNNFFYVYLAPLWEDVEGKETVRIVATNANGNEVDTTFQIEINRLPSKPSDPFPGNAAANQSTVIVLGWECVDPDVLDEAVDDSLEFELFLGRDELPDYSLISGLTETEYEVPFELEYSAQYFWKVVVTDRSLTTVEGDAWSFSTADEILVITVTHTDGGVVEFNGEDRDYVEVPKGEDAHFLIIPAEGFRVDDVLIDGLSVGPVTSYVFESVVSNHTIHASFEEAPAPEAFTVEFVILDNDGPVDGANIELGEATEITDDEGNAVFERVLPGEWAYSVTKTGYDIKEGTVKVDHEDVHQQVLIEKKSYLITVSASPTEGGEVALAGEPVHGNLMTATATPNESYEFVAWFKDDTEASGEQVYEFEARSDLQLFALFEKIPGYSLFLTSEPATDLRIWINGEVHITPKRLEFEPGSIVSVSAEASQTADFNRYVSGDDALFLFEEWDNGSTSLLIEMVMESDIALSAVFSSHYMVETATSPINLRDEQGEILCIEGSGWYAEGEEVRLQAPQMIDHDDIVYQFSHWNINGKKASEYSVIDIEVIEAVKVVAYFNRLCLRAPAGEYVLCERENIESACSEHCEEISNH